VNATLVAGRGCEQPGRANREVAAVDGHLAEVDVRRGGGEAHAEIVGGPGPDVFVERHGLIGGGELVITVFLEVADREEHVDLAGRARVDHS
jgi:hypothetical protein